MFAFRLLLILECFSLIKGHYIPALQNVESKEEIVVAFILDGSNSILDKDWELMKSALEMIVLRIPNNSKILVEVFSTSSESILPITLLTENRTNIQTVISGNFSFFLHLNSSN